MKTTTPGSRHRSVRFFLGFIALALVASRSDDSKVVVRAQAPPCDVVCENAKVGNPPSEWDIVGSGDPNIEGFATDLSVNRGQTVRFKIQSLTGYDIHIYRLGYYGGNGARKVGQILGLSGDVTQPACKTDSTNPLDPSATTTGLVDCGNWTESAAWQTPLDVPSGIFIAKLQRQGGGASHIPFIVRDDDYAADILFQTSDTTWQAYNQWGGGSLYCQGPFNNAGTVYHIPVACEGRAVKVSYNRPFDTRAHDARSFLFNAEYPMLRWLEKNGYAVKYWTGVDTDRFGANAAVGLSSGKKPKIFLSVGHDEYWSGAQRTNVEAARGVGVNLAFFSGNEMFWKTRWENSIVDNSTHRTLVAYKESLHGSDIDGAGTPWTGTWRDARVVAANPENALTGTLWTVNTGTAAISVPEAMGKLRLWRGTDVANLAAGQSATLGVDTLGYEWDEDVDNGARPAGLMRLSSTTVTGVDRVQDANGVVVGQGTATHNLTMYRHTSGALVFGAGTVQWAWGLDSEHDRKPLDALNQPIATHDLRMQQATVNVFADMGDVQPGSLSAGLTRASASTDTTPPDSTITGPASGSLQALNVPVVIRGTATDTGGRVAAIEVSTDGGATWNRASGTGTWVYRWIPTASGSNTVQSRAIDDSGNLETTTPSIQVTVTSPNQAPGGPVLVVTSVARPFSHYYAEILRTEGINIFNTADIANVSAGTLGSYDVVVLGEMALTPGQVAILTDWVTSGGNLIAMRPDKQLYGLLGLAETTSTLSNAYLRINAQTVVPTAGIAAETMQFHGTADVASLNGATSVATFYSDATTATTSPAITLRSVGTAGGQAAAFLYDLARSVALTRQGNPEWAGQERDGHPLVRSDDMFFGGTPNTDWVNLSKVHIPQADEQQRLFANTILHVAQDRKPLPRFWYFPRDEKAVVVLTTDSHGLGSSTARLEELNTASAESCSVGNWDCLRGTAYIYPNSLGLFDGDVASYVAQGHEVALHVNTGCLNTTAVSLEQTMTAQLDELALRYPSMPSPRTNRTHCIVWSDYTSQAEVDLQLGIRLDATYYYWPGTWIQNRPGFMGGSGMPMRFAKSTGELIDVYQAVTFMNDEDNSSQTYPFTIDSLLDRAIGSDGYYGAFTANMHGDGGQNSDVKLAAIVKSAKDRSVPVVSASQMLDWLDGRNNSSFGSLTWTGTTLSFTVTRATGANGLRGMLPAFSGGALAQITLNGTAIPFTIATIKGISYALFDATTGGYQATYQADNIAPVISSVSATAQSATTAAVTFNTNEPATTRVDYGTQPTSVTQVASDDALFTNHALTLTGLSPNTTYYYRVTAVDFFNNGATVPLAAEAPLTFTTPPLVQSFLDTTAADFSGGTTGTETFVAQTGDGEVILKPTDGAEFFGPDKPAGWITPVTPANGQLVLNNQFAGTAAQYGVGRSLEFVANFGADAFQHSGFGQNFNCGEPWAIFSTAATTGQLHARTTTSGCGTDQDQLIPGNWIGSFHRYRIEWNAGNVTYFIDGQQVAQHNITIASLMRPAASDFDQLANAETLILDWERLSPYPAQGSFLSRVFDATQGVKWYSLAWTSETPAATALSVEVRVGNTPTPNDGTWSAFVPVAPGSPISGLAIRRYLQYRATLSTSNPYVSPHLRSVTVNHEVAAANTAPTATDDTARTAEDTPHTFAASGPGSLTANDIDAETPAQLTVTAVANASNGTVILNLDGSVTFTPIANLSGVGAFTYTVSDGALTDDGIVTVTIDAVNDEPVGIADPSPASGSVYQATEDVALSVPVATGVLANDTDVDNAALTAQVHTPPAHGTLTLNLDGSFVYTPAANYSGPDGFFYRASDGTAFSTPTGVSILVQGVNDAPVANNDRYAVSRSGVPVAITSLVLNGSTANATTAVDHGFTIGHPIRVEGATQVEYNGTFTVTAAGARTFSYTVVGTPASPATGTIRATAEDMTRTFAAPGVIANDLDSEGQPLTASLGATTENGTLVFNSDGSFTYTPSDTFVGVDTFRYSLSDGFGVSGVATATITVHNEVATAVVGEGGGTVATGPEATALDPLETSVATPIAGEVSIEQGPISPQNPSAGYTFLGQQVDIRISTITDASPLTNPSTPLLITFTADKSLVASGQTEQTLQVFRNGVLLQNCPAGPLTLANYPCVSDRTALAGGDVQFTVKALAPSQWNVGAFIASDARMSTLEDATLTGNVSSLSGHPNPGSLTYGTGIGPLHGTLTMQSNGSFDYRPNPTYSGDDSFMYSAADGNGGIGFGTVSITIIPVNNAPKADAQSVTTNEDTAAAMTLTGSDVDDTLLTFSIVTPPQHGTLTGAPPNVQYAPAANYNGPDSFTFTTRDTALTSAPATVTITVNAINDAPAATLQSVTTDEDTAKAITLTGSDVDGDALTFAIATPPTNGSLSGTAPILTYTPNANYSGPDSFTFTVRDGAVTSAAATVTIAVNGLNDAPTATDQSVTTGEDTATTITLTGSDPEGDLLSFRVVTPGPAHGTLTGTAPNLTYTPAANYSGPDSFLFTVTDIAGLTSSTATVTINVTAVNDRPIATPQSVVTDEDTAKTITLAGSDVEGSALTFAIATPPTKGALSGTAPNLTYTPNPNVSGSDSFTFTVSDGALTSATETVSITVTAVNDAPTATPQTVTAPEDAPTIIALAGSDVDGSVAAFAIATQPAHGTATLAGPNVTYTPAANYSGPDSFTFTTTDNLGLKSAAATVTINVGAVNDAPTATAQSVATAEDTPKSITLAGTDAEGSALTFSIATQPTRGTLSGVPPSVTYTPNGNYNGPDSFTFTANDGSLASAPATVTIDVTALNDAPTAAAQSATADEDTPKVITLTGGDVDGDALTFSIVTGPTNGTLSGTAPILTYTPASNYSGPDSFTFKTTDAAGLASAVATVTIAVSAVNDPPAATGQTVVAAEDTAEPITLAGTDVEGTALTFAIGTSPTHGTLSGAAPNLTYTPAANYNGPDSFTFTVRDGALTSPAATVTINVTAVNDRPAATAQSATTDEDLAKVITLAGSDIDGDALTFAIAAPPTNGTLSVAGPNVTYTPAPNYNGPDSFTFTTTDTAGLTSAAATVAITVNAINDTPTAAGQSVVTNEDAPKTITLAGSDVETATLTFAIATPPTKGTLSGAVPNLTYTPNANYSGPDSLTFTVSDGALTSTAATVTITVNAVNDAPTATTQSVAATEDTPKGITLAGSDVEGSALTFAITTQPTKGTLSGTGPNLTYTPNANYNGPDSFAFTTNDGALTSAAATVSITVAAVNDAPSATGQTVAATEDTAKGITLAGSDVEGSTLTFAIVTPPTKGTLSGTAPNLTYTPNANYNGPDSFTFTANDGALTSAAATVSITVAAVNDAPAATAQTVAASEDTQKAVTLAGTDPDGDALTFTVTAQPANGTLTGTAPNLTYTPAANYSGPDSFTFAVSDPAALTSAAATVTITVAAVNDTPSATAQTVAATEDTAKAITLAGSDVEGSPLTFAIATAPTKGALSGTAPNLTYTPNANYSGPDSFAFTTNDGALTSAAATVSITVAAVNDAPLATAQAVAATEDTAKGITLAGSDVEGSALTFAITTASTKGTLTGVAPNLTYTPNANYSGPDSFAFTTNDGAATSAPATVTITVAAVNDTPSATAQTVAATEDTPKGITLAGSDVEGSALTFAIATAPTKGTLTGTAPNLTYTPNANYSGPDSFTFTANDGAATSAPATVTITVAAVNDAPSATAQTVAATEDTQKAVTLAGTDPDGGALTFTVTAQPANGTLGGTAPNLTYTPAANYSGPDSFTFTVSDPSAVTSAPATVTITVAAVNDAPSATAQSVAATEDTAKAITLAGSDVEGSPLTFAIATAPTKGALSGTAPNLTYTPNANYSGPDSFAFTTNDGAVTSAAATVSITVAAVNDAPLATAQAVAATEDTAKGITLAGSDVEGSALTFAITTAPTKGTLTGVAPNLTYTPNANYSGPDSFAFTTNDGAATSAPATVTITVAAVNDAPSATAQSVGATEDTAKAVTLAGSDVEGSPLTFAIATAPTKGALSGTAPNLTYTPNANYSGSDSFTFTANDGAATSAPATVSITVAAVNDAPAATAQTVAATEDTQKAVTLAGTDPDADALTFTVTAQPANGTLSGTAPNLTYTPAANYSGSDSFTFTVSDPAALTSGPATVTITVAAVNDTPSATAQSVAATEDTAKAITLAGSDVEGSPLTFAIATAPTKGALSGTAPNLTYTPNANYSGPDSFTFTANDGATTSAPATVTITVAGVNDAPAATAQSVTTNEDTAKAIVLAGSDPENASLTFTVLTQPTRGTLSGTAPNLTYTPNAGLSGPDSFTFKVNDGVNDSAAATVSINVVAINDAPTISDIANQTSTGAAVGPVSFTVNDLETPLANLTLTGTSSNPTLVPNANITFGGSNGNRTVTVTPASGQSGSATITVTVSDGSLNASDTFAVTVTVSAPSTPTTTSAPTSSAATTTFGTNVTLTSTVTASGGTPTGNVEFFDSGISLGTATLSGGSASLTTNGIAAGTRSITAKYLGSGTYAASTSTATTVTVSKASATSTWSASPTSVQYSDVVTFKASVSPATIGGTAPAKFARFKIGTQVMGTAPLVLNTTTGNLEAVLTTPLLETVAGQMKPGARTTFLEFVDVNPSVTLTNKSGSLQIRAEDALTKYVGPVTVTICATCTTATIRLEAEVTEVADGNLGDVRKPTVQFVNRATGTAIGTATLDTAKSTSTKAYYYFNWNVTVSGSSQTFTVGTSVSIYYLRNSTTENGSVTVTKQ